MKEKWIVSRLAIVFLIISLLVAFLGFGVVVGYSWTEGKIVFFVSLVVAVLFSLGTSDGRRSY